ncbi:MAG: SCO family protein [Alphaproteobacteria bacterium]|nr:SCO family protein [Alphaproteobacteria bacterium]
MTNRMRTLFLGLIALAAAVATAAVMLLAMGTPAPRPAAAGDVGGAFTLTDQDGRRVTEADFRGRYLLLFFGFTNCPDVCPMTLGRIADALDIAPALKEKLTPVLVSVDPERDTPANLKAYLAFFGPEFRGLTGSPEEIAAVLKAYKVYAKRTELPDSALEYTMDHSSLIFLYGPDGAFITAFDPSLDAAGLAAELTKTVR